MQGADESGRVCGRCRSSNLRFLTGDASLECKHPSSRTTGHLVGSLAETCLEVKGLARFAPDLQRFHLVASRTFLLDTRALSSRADHLSWTIPLGLIGSWTILSQSLWQGQPCLDSLTSIPCPMKANELVGCLQNSISLLQGHSRSGNRGVR